MKSTLLPFLGALALLFTGCNSLNSHQVADSTYHPAPALDYGKTPKKCGEFPPSANDKILRIINSNGPVVCEVDGSGSFILPTYVEKFARMTNDHSFNLTLKYVGSTGAVETRHQKVTVDPLDYEVPVVIMSLPMRHSEVAVSDRKK